jgi:hypothetical protein
LHFKTITKDKFDLYTPFLEIKELSYLRITEKISPEAIKVII